jgi:hypothetical protein
MDQVFREPALVRGKVEGIGKDGQEGEKSQIILARRVN